MSTITIPRGVDARRLRVAMHELGHLTAWERLDGRVVEVRLSRWSVGGHVRMDWPTNPTETNMRGYLVGALAGHEADLIWCERTGDRHDHGACAHDLTMYRNGRTAYRAARAWSDRDLHRAARDLVLANWTTMLPRAETLARKGRL
jgi:hypothetical protein